MSLNGIDRKKILEMVRKNKITPEEGFKLLKQLGNTDKAGDTVPGAADYGAKKTIGEPSKSNAAGKSIFEDIAIIGVSGRFPGAKNADEFWHNLSNGVDSVREIPKERWDIDKYFNTNIKAPEKTYCKCSGNLSDIDKFDALFFNISPKEAEMMDPQQRLFLEESWKALEDAGYSPDSLSGSKTGVFVGVTQGDYDKRVRNSGISLDAQLLTGMQISMLSARISYFLNLTGPNMSVDTACSSSLVAINLACQSIQNGESEMAIAGGVHILTTPDMHIMTSKGAMLSKEGKCKAFDNSADGFVPGEGVGILVLKRLSKAIEDRDNIYGVIKGSRVNQDGKTNGITAPSASSQYRLEREVYETFGINPETITYIEAHGTGTKLGDPIEVSALTKTFRHYTQKNKFCALGSVKTNIGHGLTSAGVSGLIKILLCMKHKKLVPSLHFNKSNEHINFEDSPFYVNTELKDWETDENMPMRAAISSFGLSGTNCHMIIEEAPKTSTAGKSARLPYYLAVFSAASEKSLNNKYKDLAEYLNKNSVNIENLSYTLSSGRSHLVLRSYIIVKDIEDLKQKLREVIDKGNTDSYSFNNLRENQFEEDPDIRRKADALSEELGSLNFNDTGVYREKLFGLASLYIEGYDIDFNKLYRSMGCRRISLPTYPFDGDRYWLEYKDDDVKEDGSVIQKLHPLVGRNTSNFMEQKYTTTLIGNEFYMTDHVIGGSKVLPGVAYIEMARASSELASEKKVANITDVVWVKPLSVTQDPLDVDITLFPKGNLVEYEVTTAGEGNERILHSKGKVVLETTARTADETVDIEAVKGRCAVCKNGEECYRLFNSFGVKYGNGFKVIKEMYTSPTECLTVLQLPDELNVQRASFALHPSIMDGALQTVIGLKDSADSDDRTAYLPYAVDKVEIFRPLKDKCYVYAVFSENNNNVSSDVKSFNIEILDEEGRVAVRLKDYLPRRIYNSADQAKKEKAPEVIFLKSAWKRTGESLNNGITIQGPVMVLASDAKDAEDVKNKADGPVYLIKPGKAYKEGADGVYTINPASMDDYTKLIEAVKAKSGIPSKIIYMWGSEDFKTTNKDLQLGLNKTVYSLLYISKALFEQKPKNEIKLIYVFKEQDDGVNPVCAATEGFARTIRLENPKFVYKTIKIKGGCSDASMVMANEMELLGDDFEVSYIDGERHVKVVEECSKAQVSDSSIGIKENGAYIITGGAGGLGLIFAEYLAGNYKANVVLSGRSDLSKERLDRIKELSSNDAEVMYIKADISKKQDAQMLVKKTKDVFGNINGIIHSAGIVKDAFILNKKTEEMEQVLNPKVFGIVNMDEAVKEEKLDFFIAFSSMGSITGNVGQCDYAYANSFMDNYIEMREVFRIQEKRRGKSLSINWPLWKDGGMSVDEKSEGMLRKKLGMLPLSTVNGIEGFEYGLKINDLNLIVIEGIKDEIRLKLGIEDSATPYQAADEVGKGSLQKADLNYNELYLRTEKYLGKILSGIIKLAPEKIHPKEAFESYGIDSVMIVSLNEEFEKYFGELSRTLFFEYQNLEALTKYFVENLREKLLDKPEISGVTGTIAAEDIKTKPAAISGRELLRSSGPRFDMSFDKKAAPGNQAEDDAVAIIGVSGRYPMAKDIEEFWQNLKDGRDCISEIPEDRWDYRQHFDSDKNAKGKYYSKWGGFIDDADKFDAMFFNIAPREAEMVDPQERLFLETAWKTVQDSGYSKSGLNKYKVGVFVGAMYGHYQMYGAEETQKGNPVGLSSSFASIANRVSYYFDFHGPSIAIDTMCSSSLTSVHLACRSIKNGECDMALAGGVNLSLHSNKYILLGQGKFLSSDGRCRSFGAGGDGYVPGEGVGAVMLKSLEKAKTDGDYIYGVIKVSAVNHGGKTNGYTVPNPVEQGNLIGETLKKANIDPRTLSYIETHGTGTTLGDPIEITGLVRAFGPEIADKKFCPIGSAKSNIGHLESAAGIAAITKVLLMMKHKKLVPSLHSSKLNPNINFDNTPFYVQQVLEDWNQPVIKDGVKSEKYPRRAGISSFGAGGSNAHIIIEEYGNPLPEAYPAVQDRKVILLSARNEESLRGYAREMHAYITKLSDSVIKVGGNAGSLAGVIKSDLLKIVAGILNVGEENIDDTAQITELGLDPVQAVEFVNKINEKYNSDLNIELLFEKEDISGVAHYMANVEETAMSASHRKNEKTVGTKTNEAVILESMAYTLQTGREPMEERLALAVSSLEDLKEKLAGFLENKVGNSDIYRGSLRANKTIQPLENNTEELVKEAIKNKKPDELVRLWISGMAIEWKLLYGDFTPVRIPLPSCSLAKKRYWYNGYTGKVPASANTNKAFDKPNTETVKIYHTGKNPGLQEKMMEAALNYKGNEVELKIIDGNIALVTMQDRKNKNMFSTQIIDGLMSKFAEIKANKEIKAAIVTGYDSVFCMGGTQEQLNNIADKKNSFTDVPFLYKGLLEADIPVISAMQGHASGGGMLFGLYADIVIMSEESVYSAVFTKYGFTPGMGATFILKEKLGNNLAAEMMFTARAFRGEELRDRGASVIFRKRKNVLSEAINTARLLAEKPRYTLEILKRELADRVLGQIDLFIEREEHMHSLTFSNPEVKQRIQRYYLNSAGESKSVPGKNSSQTDPVSGEKAKNSVNTASKAKKQDRIDEEVLDRILTDLEQGKITPEQAFMLTKC